MDRREFLQFLAAVSVLPGGCAEVAGRQPGPAASPGVVLNDVHSRLNETRVARVARPSSVDELAELVARAGRGISIAGGRHSMGGQQFGTGTLHIDTRGLTAVRRLDRDAGIVEVDAGIQWPELIARLFASQLGDPAPWGIVQKQTGADAFTLGGSLSANGHGRGLRLAPLVGDVEWVEVIDAKGNVERLSRTRKPDLFGLVVGGYGLFGVMSGVGLRLRPRERIERTVEIRDAEGLPEAFAARIREGHLYGDFQFDVNNRSERFLQRGVFSTYRPTDRQAGEIPRELTDEDWMRFLFLTHRDKARAFDDYVAYYRSTDGQVYWTDTHQLSVYPPGYHSAYDRKIGAKVEGSEMITELYVPRGKLPDFLSAAARELRALEANVIYGTVRWIEADDATFLPWARKPWACTVLNLHVDHSPEAIDRAKTSFRVLIDLALDRGGSYFLTYHRWATRKQLLAAYPQFEAFLRKKREHDPDDRFRSDWYDHHRAWFA